MCVRGHARMCSQVIPAATVTSLHDVAVAIDRCSKSRSGSWIIGCVFFFFFFFQKKNNPVWRGSLKRENTLNSSWSQLPVRLAHMKFLFDRS